MTRLQWPNDSRLLLHLLLLSQRFRALLLACCQRLNGGLADETKDGLETMLKASRSLHLPMTRDTRIALFLTGELVAALRANNPDTFA